METKLKSEHISEQHLKKLDLILLFFQAKDETIHLLISLEKKPMR